MTIHYTSALGFIQLGILPTTANSSTNRAMSTSGSSAVSSSTSNNNEACEPDRKRVKSKPVVFTSTDCAGGLVDLTGSD